MRRYTKHLQTILQTQNLQNTKHSTHTPPKQWSMERRKMLASTIQFSHNTPTPQQPHKPHDHCRAGQQDNHNHAYAWLLCAAPDTQQHANTLTNMFAVLVTTQVCYAGTPCPAGMHPPGISNNNRWQSHTRRLNHPVPQPWAQQNKSSLERR